MSSSNSTPVLGYWRLRGLCQHIRLLLNYVGADFEDKTYEFGPGPDFHKESWLAEKFQLGLDFPNLPYLIDGDVKITESKAILKYVVATRGKALLPATPQKQAVADMLEGVLNDVQRSLIDYSYAPTGSIPTTPDVSNATKFEELIKFLGQNKWALGDKISYIDFVLYEVLYQMSRFNKNAFNAYPSLQSYLQRFEAIPELADYIKSSTSLTVYSPHATLLF